VLWKTFTILLPKVVRPIIVVDTRQIPTGTSLVMKSYVPYGKATP